MTIEELIPLVHFISDNMYLGPPYLEPEQRAVIDVVDLLDALDKIYHLESQTCGKILNAYRDSTSKASTS